MIYKYIWRVLPFKILLGYVWNAHTHLTLLWPRVFETIIFPDHYRPTQCGYNCRYKNIYWNHRDGPNIEHSLYTSILKSKQTNWNSPSTCLSSTQRVTIVQPPTIKVVRSHSNTIMLFVLVLADALRYFYQIWHDMYGVPGKGVKPFPQPPLLLSSPTPTLPPPRELSWKLPDSLKSEAISASRAFQEACEGYTLDYVEFREFGKNACKVWSLSRAAPSPPPSPPNQI